MSKIAKLVTILTYLTGIAFGLFAILNLKKVKDMPAQEKIALVISYLAVSFVGLFVLLKRIQLSVTSPQSNEYD